MGLSDVSSRRRNLALLISGNVPPPASIVFTRLAALLSLATSPARTRRNELTAVRATLLLGPVLMGSGRGDDGKTRARGESNDNMELQDAVEAAEVMRTVLEDVDYYVEGLRQDIGSRQERLKGRVDELNSLVEKIDRKLDVRLVKEGDDDDVGGVVRKGERFVEGGIGESGSEDVEIVSEFLSIVSKGREGEALEGKEGSAILEEVRLGEGRGRRLLIDRCVSLPLTCCASYFSFAAQHLHRHQERHQQNERDCLALLGPFRHELRATSGGHIREAW